MQLELVITGGTVVDGTGRPPFRADVGIGRGRIAAVEPAARLTGDEVLDATGLVVTPGFVDVDSHVDWAVARGDLDALGRWTRQGVTTAIGGACGFSAAPVLPGGADAVARAARFLYDGAFAPAWGTFAEFLSAVAARGLPLSVGFLVGQNTIAAQAAACGRGREPLAVLLEETREALRAGALGFSANAATLRGIVRGPSDLAAVAAAVAAEDALLAVHARAYTRIYPGYGRSASRGPANVRAVRDLAALARGTGVRLHVLHLAAAGRRTWSTVPALLGAIDAARADGVDVGFDAAPHGTAVGPILFAFPEWFASGFPARTGRAKLAALRATAVLQRVLLGLGFDDLRLRQAPGEPALAALEGRSFAEIGRRLGVHPIVSQVELARRAGMTGASVLFGAMSADARDDTALRAVLAHPHCCIGTNAASTATGPQNPSVTDAFPRFLGRYVRELRLVRLEEAVRRMTSLPADRAGVRGVGRVAAGLRADLVVLDLATVGGAKDPESPTAAPTGIRAVLVSGVPVVQDGRVRPGVLPGRVLTRSA